MRIIGRAADMAEAARAFRAAGEGVALVPTMGALHDGHLSLVALASRGGRRVVVSVFVNPTQFGPGEDFDRYPRDPAGDAARLEKAGADVLFMPDAGEVYPPGFASWVQLPSMENVLCGRYRPGHFRGVATVCCILFGMVGPDAAVFGRKDAQQLAIIKRMVSDLRLGVGIVEAPIVREADGLAMSSRNAYLTPPQRAEAPRIFGGLRAAAALAASGRPCSSELASAFRAGLEDSGELAVQYVELVDPSTLEPMDVLDRDGLLAVAVLAGRTRLIDNLILRPGAGAVEV